MILNKMQIKLILITLLFLGLNIPFPSVRAEIWIDQAPWAEKAFLNSIEFLHQDTPVSEDWKLNGEVYFIKPGNLVADCEATCGAMAKRCVQNLSGGGNLSFRYPGGGEEWGPLAVYVCSKDNLDGLTGMSWGGTMGESSGVVDYGGTTPCDRIGLKGYKRFGLAGDFNFGDDSQYRLDGVVLCQECGCNGKVGDVRCELGDNQSTGGIKDGNNDGIDDDCGSPENPTGKGDSSGWGGWACSVFPTGDDDDDGNSCGRDFSLSISRLGDEDDESTEEEENYGWGCPPFDEDAIVKWDIAGIFNKCEASSDNTSGWNGNVSTKVGPHEKNVHVNTWKDEWDSIAEMFPDINLKCTYMDEIDNKEKYLEKTLVFSTSIYNPPPAAISVSHPDPIVALPIDGVVTWDAGEYDMPEGESEIYKDDGTGHVELGCRIRGVNIDTGNQMFNSSGNNGSESVTFTEPGYHLFTVECMTPPSPEENYCVYEGIYGSTYVYVPDVPPTVTLSASPNPVDGKAPLKTTATWNSNYANSCSLNFSPKTDVSGSDVVSREGGSGNKCALKEGLTASCTGDGGVGEASTTAEFKFKPDIKVNQKEITTNDGKKFVLYDWTAKNVTMCTVSEFSNGRWSDPSCSVGECRNDGGSGSLAQDSCVQVVCAGSGGAPVSTLIQNGSCTPKSTGLVFCVK